MNPARGGDVLREAEVPEKSWYMADFRMLSLCIVVVAVQGCNPQDATYTLYRNSLLDVNMRIHVASFDSKDGEAYNRENCELGARLFMGQPNVTARFWCEKGAYRK